MSIPARFGLLLGAMLLALGSALFLQHWLERRSDAAERLALAQQQARELDHWLTATGSSFGRYVSDYARALAAGEEDSNLGDPLDSDVAALWLLRADGTLQRAIAAPGLLQPPVSATEIAVWAQSPPPDQFFAEAGGRLLEMRVTRLPAAEPTGQVAWVLAAKPWDESHLRLISHLTGGTAILTPPAATTGKAAVGTETRPLADWQGATRRLLKVKYPEEAPTLLQWAIAPHLPLFLSFAFLLMVAFGLSLQQWVLRPLGRIDASLQQDDARLIQELCASTDEFGRVARLLDKAHTQRNRLKEEIEKRRRTEQALLASEDQLRRTLDERIRLGRDLHDGVIQSLYACGMGLAGVRSLLPSGQTEAVARLEQIRDALNTTIHDVRNFITGLEPELLRQQTFAQAIAELLVQMRELGEARCTSDIDGALADRLSLSQRANLLQITREAVSNALRHGQARTVQVALRREGENGLLFEISDDGRGFAADRTEKNGHGLANLAQRAREMGAAFTTRSEPGRGTHLRFTFNPQAAP